MDFHYRQKELKVSSEALPPFPPFYLAAGLPSVESLNDSPSVEIIWRTLHNDPVPRKNTNSVDAHTAGYVRKHFMSSIHLYAEKGIREGFPNNARKLDRVLTSHLPRGRCWSALAPPHQVKTSAYPARASRSPSLNTASLGSRGYGPSVAYPSTCGTESQDDKQDKTPLDNRQGPSVTGARQRAGVSTRRI